MIVAVSGCIICGMTNDKPSTPERADGAERDSKITVRRLDKPTPVIAVPQNDAQRRHNRQTQAASKARGVDIGKTRKRGR